MKDVIGRSHDSIGNMVMSGVANRLGDYRGSGEVGRLGVLPLSS